MSSTVVLPGGHHSAKVIRKGNVVEKYYKSDNKLHRKWFERETKWMQRLGNSNITPRFLGASENTTDGYHVIRMSYVGKRKYRDFSKKERKMVKSALHELKHKHGIVWKSSKLPSKRNVTFVNDKAYLIDFNSRRWQNK